MDPDSGEPVSVVLAARLRDGEWMAPETVATTRTGGVGAARVALDDAGDGLITWIYSAPYDEDQDCSPHNEFLARTDTPGSGLGPTTALEIFEGCHRLTGLAVAMNAAGVGAAAWSGDGVSRARLFR
jgi:hypothetical protein